MERAKPTATKPKTYLGIDLGGTFTKFGLVSAGGELLIQDTIQTPAGGRDALLAHLKNAAQTALALSHARGEAPVSVGIATADGSIRSEGTLYTQRRTCPAGPAHESAVRLRQPAACPLRLRTTRMRWRWRRSILGWAKRPRKLRMYHPGNRGRRRMFYRRPFESWQPLLCQRDRAYAACGGRTAVHLWASRLSRGLRQCRCPGPLCPEPRVELSGSRDSSRTREC